jgi:hypothetical protein
LRKVDRKVIIFFHEIFCLVMFLIPFGQMSVSAQAVPAWIQNLESAFPSREWVAVTAQRTNQSQAEAAVMNALARAFRTNVASLTETSQRFNP